MPLDSSAIKQIAFSLGADLCGITAASSFSEAPKGHHPQDLLSGCRSVIVLAQRFPSGPGVESPEAYTAARNQKVHDLDSLAAQLANELLQNGMQAQMKGSMGPSRWEEDGRYRDTLSLKHAAELAGLGHFGKNNLIINDRYGSMLWFSAVLTTAALEADPPARYSVCPPACHACISVCPGRALGSAWVTQQACFDHAYTTQAGEELILCHACRGICPQRFGLHMQQPVL